MWQKLWFSSLLVLVVLLFCVEKVQAFSISPTKYLMTVAPGESQTVYLTVKNEEQKERQFKIFVGGIRQDERGAIIFGVNTEEAEQWVRPEKNIISLKSGEEEKVGFFVSVPSGASPLSHFLGLAAETMSGADQPGVNQIGGRLFSILSIQIAGQVYEVVELGELKAEHVFTWDNNWKVGLEINNKGNIDVPLRSRLFVSYFGQEILSEDWPTGSLLLAGMRRYLEKEMSPQALWPGKYQIRTQITYGRTQQAVTALVSVWYFPKWSLGMIGVLLGAGLLLVYGLRQRRSNL